MLRLLLLLGALLLPVQSWAVVAFSTHNEIIDTDANNSITVTVPSGLTTGDTWVVCSAIDGDAASIVLSTPSGFTAIGSTLIGADHGYPYVACYYKVAGASESSATLTYTGVDYETVTYSIRLTGGHATTPFDVLGTSTPAGFATTTDAPDVTVGDNDSLAILLYASNDVATLTQPTGTTLIDSRLSGYPAVGVAYQAVNAGSYAPSTWANASVDDRIAMTFVIKPTGGGAGPDTTKFRLRVQP